MCLTFLGNMNIRSKESPHIIDEIFQIIYILYKLCSINIDYWVEKINWKYNRPNHRFNKLDLSYQILLFN